MFLAVATGLLAIPLTLVLGSNTTRGDRLFGVWIGLAITLPVYATVIALSLR
jgi:hypothetical protein